MVTGDALGAHRAELTIETGPELLQAHPPTLTRARTPALPRRNRGAAAAYPRPMLPGTGSGALDTVLQIGIALALLVSIVLLIRNYRGR